MQRRGLSYSSYAFLVGRADRWEMSHAVYLLTSVLGCSETNRITMKKLVCVLLLFIIASCTNKKYEVIKEDVNANICRMQIKIPEKVNEEQLTGIANELRDDRKSYEKLWISFYLPDLLPDSDGNGAWAVVSYTPNFEMNILGKKIAADRQDSKAAAPFPQYKNAIEVLKANNDYQNQCLEDLSKGNDIHVRVSSEFLNTEDVSLLKEQTKRDIVYVVFQTFAQTNLEKFTVTAIPIVRTSFNPNLKYDGKKKEDLKQTITITRAKAQQILKKYFESTAFINLYQLDGTIYSPNENFERLKNAELESVFWDLK